MSLLDRRKKANGLSGTSIHTIYKHMKRRCTNPKCKSFKNYGGRGIKICEQWNTFIGFANDMLESYESGLSIERIDVNGDYCKENCRWATQAEQQLNRRNNIVFEYLGEIKVLSEWARKYEIPYPTLWFRIYKHNMTFEQAINKKANERPKHYKKKPKSA